MRLFDTMTIVTKDYLPLQQNEPPLAYLLPGDLSAANKSDVAKKESAHMWAVGYHPKKRDGKIEHNFENKPTDGFRIGDVTKRYSTSNKFFRIIDPRGFELEISTENMNELIQTGNIIRGEIIGKHVWVKQGRDTLINVQHPEYVKHLLPPEQKILPELKPGDKVKLPYQGEMIFVGAYYIAKCGEETKRNPAWSYHTGWNTRRDTPEYLVDLVIVNDTTLTYVFHTPDSGYRSKDFLAMRKPKKFEFVSSGNPTRTLQPNMVYDFGGAQFFHGIVFNTTAEVKAFDALHYEWPRRSYYSNYPINTKRQAEKL